jgi:hypothetical protein
MATLKTSDNKEMILACKCGCDEGIRVRINDFDDSLYAYQTYISGNWCKEQGTFFGKLKKIWAIIRNKDFYYSEICFSKEDWDEYKSWVNLH